MPRNHLEQGKLSSEEPSWFQSCTYCFRLIPLPLPQPEGCGSCQPSHGGVPTDQERAWVVSETAPSHCQGHSRSKGGVGPEGAGAEGWACLPLGWLRGRGVATRAGEERDLSPQTQMLMDTHTQLRHAHSFTYTHTHTLTHTCTHVHTLSHCTYTYAYTHMCTHSLTLHTHVHAHMCTHAHIAHICM